MQIPEEALLIRYGEIGLKGGNRPRFEKILASNLRVALSNVPSLTIQRIRGRMLVRGQTPTIEMAVAARRVFGVTSVSPAQVVARNPEAMLEAARTLAAEAIAREHAGTSRIRFKVSVNRADKTFPLRSIEVARTVGAALIADESRLIVDLKDPELEIGVDLRTEGVYVFAGRQKAYGGLPVSSTGRVHCLLSGGFDSPVAAWQCMKRGMRVDFVSFYSFPFVGPQTREKVLRIAEKLTEWQPQAMLYVVPFSPYQEAIRDHCDERYRTVLYRRAMQRIASVIARTRKGKALVTGESIGQVASQTLENLRLIESASKLPVLRPLVTFDKTEIIALAREIGTHGLSNLPAPDCCTVFQPAQPVIHGQLSEVEHAEAQIDIGKLTYDAVQGTERISLLHQP
ncbi:MAG: tRNA 4-thiouridine(8) synthase ThiI [Planctomycetes bacterium]|nr:tRNA 4-thiouridine(8) synthase ThiI [Planctomycetota bacterium]